MLSNTRKPHISEEESRATRPQKDTVGIRRCLSCKKDFESEGWHNRLCFNCRKQS